MNDMTLPATVPARPATAPATSQIGEALRRLARAWLNAQLRVAGPPWDGATAHYRA